ncbi:MAG: hypothetical protein U0791_18530 [Gemmataceae bacterium]
MIGSRARPPRIGEPASAGVAYYRTDHELSFYLRALQRFQFGRLVVVLALQQRSQLLPAEMPSHVRLILTANPNDIDSHVPAEWLVPEPLKAVLLAMAGLDPEDGLILLFPADWSGDSPDSLIEKAKQRLPALTGSRVDSNCE